MCVKVHMQALANCMKDGCQVVHAGITRRREHPVQAFTRLGCERGKLFEAHRRIDQIAQDQPCCLWFPIKKKSGRFIHHGCAKAESRSTRSITVCLKSRVSAMALPLVPDIYGLVALCCAFFRDRT